MEKEAIEIIEDLIETILWLGGDAYEMEAVTPSIEKAREFIEKYSTKK